MEKAIKLKVLTIVSVSVVVLSFESVYIVRALQAYSSRNYKSLDTLYMLWVPFKGLPLIYLRNKISPKFM
jgi:hypothetical protein